MAVTSASSPLFTVTRQASRALDIAIAQVGHPQIEKSRDALLQLELLCRDRKIACFLVDQVDLLLSMVVTQIRKLQSLIPSSTPEERKNLCDQYLCIIRLLYLIFKPNNEVVTSKVTKSQVCELIYLLIMAIRTSSVEAFPHDSIIFSKINTLVVQIIEYGEPSAVTCGLLRMLNTALQLAKTDDLMLLVLKCQSKLLKQFSSWKQMGGVLTSKFDLEGIIREYHSFLNTHSFRKRDNSTAIKIMQTILFKLFKLVGEDRIYEILDSMSDLNDSKTASFIRKVGHLQRIMPEENKTDLTG